MKRLIVLVLFFYSLTIFAELKIGIIGDQTGSNDLTKSYSILEKGCNVLRESQPQLILHVGDIVESSYSDDKIKYDFKIATDYLNSIGVPWYTAAGDHDVNPPGDYTPGTTNYSKRNLFLNLLKKEYSKHQPPLNISNLYYSFDFDGYHFICLYSEDSLRTDPRWGNIFMNKISEDQFNWLKNDLSNSAGRKGSIVFLHQPMWYNVTGWEKVHNLLKERNVMAVIAGHFHYNQDEGYRDGIRYIVVGSTGGEIKNASENAGGLYHVTLLTLTNENNLGLQIIPLSSEIKNINFTSRNDMDRIQAIDTMLSSFPYGDYKNKAVQANPIDVPVDILSSQDGKSWTSAFPSTLPGIGISLSNLSSVTLKGPPYNDPPNTTNSSGGTRVKFNSEGQVFWDQILYDSGSEQKKAL